MTRTEKMSEVIPGAIYIENPIISDLTPHLDKQVQVMDTYGFRCGVLQSGVTTGFLVRSNENIENAMQVAFSVIAVTSIYVSDSIIIIRLA